MKKGRTLTGQVVRATKDTVAVSVDRREPHPLYLKVVTKTARFFAVPGEHQVQMGDKVVIRECPRVSKTKSWIVDQVIEKRSS